MEWCLLSRYRNGTDIEGPVDRFKGNMFGDSPPRLSNVPPLATAAQQTSDAAQPGVAGGRMPNTDGIGLDEAGVEVNERGYIRVNDRLETTALGVTASGPSGSPPAVSSSPTSPSMTVRSFGRISREGSAARRVDWFRFACTALRWRVSA